MGNPLRRINKIRALIRERDRLQAERFDRREAEALRNQSSRRLESTDRPSLLAYVELLTGWAFGYFRPFAEALERSIGGELRVCFAAPPQHGKTSFTLRALCWLCRYRSGRRHAYVTYNQQRSNYVAKEFRRIAQNAGFQVGGTLTDMTLTIDGVTSGIKFTSVKGSLTGYTIDGICIVDDYVADEKKARSKIERENGIRWWASNVETRRHVGTSYLVMATRWPGGDLTEHLTKSEGFAYINLKAIAEPESPDDVDEVSGVVLSDPLHRRVGESLSPLKPPEFFARERRRTFWWLAMYQGTPRQEGFAVFAPPGSLTDDGEPYGATYYKALPTDGYRVAYGVDLAYSSRTSADWSILVEAWAVGKKLYIVDVTRKQVQATSFLLTLVAAKSNRPGAPFRFYSGGGGEKGSADFIKQKLGRAFKVLPATGDKLARANQASITWNEGRVLLPDPAHIDAPWLDDFLAVVTTFTGTPGEQDDDVDALAAAHDQLMRKNKMFQALAGAAHAPQAIAEDDDTDEPEA
jgi:predicted phage terminase large subunit-like protein